MNKIVEKKHFSEKVVQLIVEAPMIAHSRRPGHFVIVICDERGERIPLTVADADEARGTITLVVQAVGESTRAICAKEPGDFLHNVVGPLGRATDIRNYGTVVCCGGGVGVAPLLPILKAMKAAGNKVISILAARTKDLIILEDEVREHSDEVIIMTDDGSYGEKGLVTAGLENVIGREHVDLVCTIHLEIGRASCRESIFSSYRPGSDDEICFTAYQEIQRSYNLLAEHSNGRWHRDVRCLPRNSRRQDAFRMRRRPRIQRTPCRLR